MGLEKDKAELGRHQERQGLKVLGSWMAIRLFSS
jgi:hypothetical protein